MCLAAPAAAVQLGSFLRELWVVLLRLEFSFEWQVGLAFRFPEIFFFKLPKCVGRNHRKKEPQNGELGLTPLP